MPIGIIFWMLMLLWFVFGLWWNWPDAGRPPYGMGGHLLQFVLFVLVGIRLFGWPVQ